MRILVLLVIGLILQISLFAEGNSILDRLKQVLPNATFQELDNGHHFKEEYIIMLEQPLDHNNPEVGTFMQRLFLAHYHENEPMLIVTEGYAAYPRYYELSDMLLSNQLIVEHRFFGASKPDNYDYQYLTNDQASEDYHRIRTLLGEIYHEDWISTGISKGGTSCLIYKSKYPDDVEVSVPYVAPLPMAREDKRCDEFILSRGSEECKQKLIDFQHTLLEQKEAIIPMVESLARRDSIHFSRVGVGSAFEYAVLEFTFSFWQYGHDCALVPENSSPEESFEYLNEIVGFDLYCDEGIEYFEPSFYQFMTENGYYGFIHDYLLEDLDYVTDFTNLQFAPQDIELNYNQDYLKYVRVDLYHNGDKILYIHGDLDPWAACKIIPSKKTDALLMIDKDGDHTTRISSFTTDEKEVIYATLKRWLNREIVEIK